MHGSIKKYNKSPCGPVCPERDLPGCRKRCERWQAYEEERLSRASEKSSYGAGVTAGAERRHRSNIKYKTQKGQGRL